MEQQAQPQDTWLVSVDGSIQSHAAFEQCFNGFYRDTDKIIVCSVVDPSKTYLPYDLTPDAISSRYKTFLLSHVHSSKYQLLMPDKKPNISVKDQILTLANETKPVALFIGYTGRKGIKAESTVMGSTTRHAVINSKVPLVITKSYVDREKNKTKGYTFLVCLDGSIKAYKGLDETKKLLRSPKDKVIACVVASSENFGRTDEIKEQFLQFQKETKANGEFLVLQYAVYIADGIIKFVNNSEDHFVDFVVLGNSGRRSQAEGITTLGSVAETLITQANANIVLLP